MTPQEEGYVWGNYSPTALGILLDYSPMKYSPINVLVSNTQCQVYMVQKEAHCTIEVSIRGMPYSWSKVINTTDLSQIEELVNGLTIHAIGQEVFTLH